MPVSGVKVTHQLAFLGQIFERCKLQHTAIVVRKVVKEPALEYKESTTDESLFRLGLLAEALHSPVQYGEFTIARIGAYPRHGSGFSMSAVEFQTLADIDIGKTVSIR